MFCLRRLEPQASSGLFQRPVNAQARAVKINTIPSERKELATAEAGREVDNCNQLADTPSQCVVLVRGGCDAGAAAGVSYLSKQLPAIPRYLCMRNRDATSLPLPYLPTDDAQTMVA